MATRLAAAMLGVSLISLLIATIVGLTAGRDLGRDLYEGRLVAMRASAAGDVEGQMRSFTRIAEGLASSPQAVEAIDQFDEALGDLLTIPAAELTDEAEAIAEAYRETYLEPLRAGGSDVRLTDLTAQNSAALYLQYNYAVGDEPIRNPESVLNPRDGSDWTDIHTIVHPIYRDIVDRVGLVDLYLIEPGNGYIVYSVGKGADLGTSLRSGPFSGSVLAAVERQVRDDPAAGTVISDLSFYDPELNTPVGVVASPVMDGSRFGGVLMLMYDSEPLTELLTAGGDWEGARFPDGAETFLVGADGTLRSEPRSYMENPTAHLDAAEAAGMLTPAERATIERSGTTVLTQRVVESTAAAGPDGDVDIARRRTVVGTEAFSTASALTATNVDWWVVAELDVDSAEGALGEFQELLVVGTAVFVVVLAFLAVGWAARIVAPVRQISDRLGGGALAAEPVVVPPRSPVEFHQLAISFDKMSTALGETRAELDRAGTQRLQLLRRLLPAQVADRVESGDEPALDEVAEASVTVVLVAGLDALVGDDGEGSDRALVDRVHAELDAIAEQHGLARVKVVGDAYFAACGHDRPYLDHVPRSLAFAGDARLLVREIGGETPSGLDVSVAVHAGPVTVGLTGGQRMVYDVWGPSVARAHQLARRAPHGEIVVSDQARRRLPDTIGVQEIDSDDDSDIWMVVDEDGDRS